MWFTQWIISWLSSISDYFYDAYVEVISWVIPFRYLSLPLYYLSSAFSNLSYYFTQFDGWLIVANQLLATILSPEQIVNYLSNWLRLIEDAWDWIVSFPSSLNDYVSSWWETAKLEVKSWIDSKAYDLDLLITQVSRRVTGLSQSWDEFTSSTLPQLLTFTQVEGLISSWFKSFEPQWEGWLSLSLIHI